MGQKREIIQINGMFCANCENRVKNALLKFPGVSSVETNFRSGRTLIICDENLNTGGLYKIIDDLGYDTEKSKEKNIQTLSILIIILALYVIAKSLGWTNLFNLFPAIENTMSLGTLFIIGILTSVHCIAMCGGINLTQSAVSSQGQKHIAKYNLEYNLGRVISYSIIGGFAGAIGKAISFSGLMRGIVAIIAGIIMITMAINMLGIGTSFGKIFVHLPEGIYKKLSSKLGGRSSFVIGLLNGFMPCGPLQSMQIYALSTGSILMGMLSMLFFSLGTVPLMFGLGVLSGKLNRRYTKYMLTVSAVLIFVMGIHMIGNGTSLSGVSLTTARNNAGRIAIESDGIQTVQTEVDYGSYESITVKQGIPVKWNIYVPDGKLNGCNGEIIVPEYDLSIKLKEGENIVIFTPEKVGTVPYSCWMGMIKSSITVTE